MPESKEEVWLELDDFIVEFVMESPATLKRYADLGMPRKLMAGGGGKGMSRYLYPRNACHRFFAGEEVVTV